MECSLNKGPVSKRPDFDERPGSCGTFLASAGDVVTLKLGAVSLLVHKIAPIGTSRYRGTIVGFEKWSETTGESYLIGAEVEFTERQVFDCASAVRARPNGGSTPQSSCSRPIAQSRGRTSISAAETARPRFQS